MKLLPIPDLDSRQVYATCVASVNSPDLRQRFLAIGNALFEIYDTYVRQAGIYELYRVRPQVVGDVGLILGHVTSGELKGLYTNQFVGKDKPGREIYDSLLSSVPLGRCPYCGYGQVTTIDHFLPKASYCWFVVFLPNLVPACRDCNHGKSAAVYLTPEAQLIHPYFEDPLVESEQWLFAEIQQTSPASIKYYSAPPQNWNAHLRTRVTNHLRDFDLARRFSIEAANELASLAQELKDLSAFGPDAVREHLTERWRREHRLRKNSWKTAMYQAAATSDWFIARDHSINVNP